MVATATKQHQVLELAKDLDLPLDAITERLGFLGQSGSGKTYAAMRLAELMLEVGAQIIAVEPVGCWWGLRAAADGKGAGYPVHVFGGIHGDVPLTPEAGALVADVLVDKQISAVLDVSDFTIGQMHTFMVDFAERFFDRKKRSPTPVHVFLEEAHTFIPQQLPPDPKAALMLNRVERIVRVGRNYGIGSSLISQMPQSVNKKALNQIACLFAMRTLGPQERKAIGTWFDDKASSSADLGLADVLSKLETGEAYVASPAWLKSTRKVKLSRKVTFDSSATPKFGVKLEAPKVLAAVDVEQLRTAMSSVVEEAEKDDPKALRKRIRELEHQLKARPEPKTERVEVPVLKDAQLKQLDKFSSSATIAALNLRTAAEELAGMFAAAKALHSPPAPTRINPGRPVSAEPPRRLPSPVQAPGQPAELAGLKKGARDMLRVLAAAHPAELTKVELGVLVGMKHSSGTFGDYLSKLRSSGFITYGDAGDQVATAAGVAAAGVHPLPDVDQVLNLWRPAFKAGARKMIDALLERPRDRGQLGEAIGMEWTSGTFGDYLSSLRSAGLVEKVGELLQLSDAVYLGSGGR